MSDMADVILKHRFVDDDACDCNEMFYDTRLTAKQIAIEHSLHVEMELHNAGFGPVQAEDLIRRESYEAGTKHALAGVEPIYKAEIEKLTAEVAYEKARAAYFKYVPEIEHDPEGVQALVVEMRAARVAFFKLSGRGGE